MDTSSFSKCAKEFYKAHPEGRSKKKKGKRAAAKQAAAACYSAMGENKSLSFKVFLMEFNDD